jgi:hypothetical protein
VALQGTRVLMLPTYEQGTWEDQVVVPVRNLVPMRDEADPLQLSMIGINPVTASRLLNRYVSLMPGDWIGQTAANSAMGQYIIALAKLAGVKMLHVVRREAAAEAGTAVQIAALEGVVLDERLLERVQCVPFNKPFDRGHLRAVLHDREGQAREDAPAVHQDRASPALPVVTPFFHPGQIQVLAQGVHGATSNGCAAPLSLRVIRLFAGNDAVGFIGASFSGVLFMLTPFETALAVSRRGPIPRTSEVKLTMARALSTC